MIKVKQLEKRFDDLSTPLPVLSGLTFDIAPGEFVAIMGPSGSGKSTLLHILSFMDRPSGGEYVFNGRGMGELSDRDLARIRNQEMGFVFQAFNLLNRATVYQNVEIPLLYSEVPAEKRRELVEEAVASVDLTDKLYTEAGKLSGGQKQRVAIARALVNNPQVIFADEPTGNLDSKSGAQVMEIFDALHRRGRTIILVTHETYTAQFASRIIRILDGQIASDEAVTERRSSKSDFFK
jgi:putative ABC transport system ATP-binding protein